MLQNVIPWGELNLTFKTHSNLSHLVRFKDPIPNVLVSNIIYSYKCPSCTARYTGKTDRHFKVRWGEHLCISCFTGEPVKGIKTVVKDHLEIVSVNQTLPSLRWKFFVGGNFVTSPNFRHFPPTKMFKRKFTLLFPFHTWNMIFLLLAKNVFPILLGDSVIFKYK